MDNHLTELFQDQFETRWAGAEAVQEADAFPRRYIDPWRAAVDVGERVAAGESFRATVEGRHTETGRAGSWSGRIVEVHLSGPGETDHAVTRPDRASLVLDTGEETVEVAGHCSEATVSAESLVVEQG